MEQRRTAGRSRRGASEPTSNVLHSVHIPGAKHFKIKKDGQVYVFSGLSPKQFKDYRGANAKVVGYFTNKKLDGVGLSRMFELKKQLHGQASKVDFEVYNASKRFRRKVAYVPIGNDEFLIYEKLPVAAMTSSVAAVALAFVIGYLALAGDDPWVNPLGIAPTIAIGGDGKTETEIETIDFAGYDSVSVTASNPYVLLQNPESNDVYFSYVLSDADGNEFMTTDLIPPGKALQWDAKSDLGSGVHSVNMHIDTYDMDDTSIPYNAMNYDDVTISVE